MFSAKKFNYITYLLITIFFLSVTISTIADITKENSIRMQFNALLKDVELFNSEHSSYLTEVPPPSEPSSLVEYYSSQDALVAGYNNYKEATSYYSEAYGRLTFSALNFPFEIDLWITNIQYTDGDFVQIIVAKEVGTLFNGKKGGLISYYKKADNKVYNNFTWTVSKQNNKWVPHFTGKWTQQSIEQYEEEFGAFPGTSIYDVTRRTAAEELYFNKIKNGRNEVREYNIQYKLNPVLSTKLYKNFLSYVLNIVQQDFVQKVEFKKLTLSSVIDANGYLKMSKYDEEFNFTVKVEQWGNVSLSATCYSEITYMFMLFNQTIPYEKPIITL